MRADSTDSRLVVSWRRRGARALGMALFLLLGGCATKAPLAGLLPGSHRRPVLRPPLMASPAPSSGQTTPTSGGNFGTPYTPTPYTPTPY
ncbi:hypothetical protein JRI60_03900 [Archangium violaceum]|uniref:hypothetical protein n=1 Tax=Archangium violaceum TaxID=83451 RepID=UPI0019517966|nr:hypothetical protein [Archangium violaceum]QRN98223.1 hypothetical protein JRI60_03900 [Archangium violaceum]